MPLRGASRRARLRRVRLVDYYGARFWEIMYVHDEAPEEVQTSYIGMESVYDDPRPGDNVIITYIAGKAASIHQTD
jgi:hypothetical protein